MKKLIFLLPLLTLGACGLDEFPTAKDAKEASEEARLKIAQEAVLATIEKGQNYITSTFDPPACDTFKKYFLPLGYKAEDLPNGACKISW